MQVVGSGKQHTGFGFATGAIIIGMMGAIVNPIEPGALMCEERPGFPVYLSDTGISEVSPRHTRLIAHHDHLEGQVIEETYGPSNAGDELYGRGIAQVTLLLDNGTIPIEKDRAIPVHPRCRVIFCRTSPSRHFF
jgi:hypothetical protein